MSARRRGVFVIAALAQLVSGCPANRVAEVDGGSSELDSGAAERDAADAGLDAEDASARPDGSEPVADAGTESDASLCGNGALDLGEECDDALFEGYLACIRCRAFCNTSFGFGAASPAFPEDTDIATCPPALPWCHFDPDGRRRCIADAPALAEYGAPCESDADCRTAFCSTALRRCTIECYWSANLCDADSLCLRDLDALGASGIGACAWPCRRSAECQPGEQCVAFGFAGGSSYQAATCVQDSWRSRGGGDRSLPAGAPCGAAGECADGACDAIAGCGELCVSDSDCGDPARPFCAPLEELPSRVPFPGLEPLHICVPPCGNGVVDAGEQCDDGNREGDLTCPATCRWRACARPSECLAFGMPCSGALDGAPTCWPGNSGAAPLGTPCTADDECESAVCGAGGHCTEHCVDGSDCPGGSCDLTADEGRTPLSPGWCRFP